MIKLNYKMDLEKIIEGGNDNGKKRKYVRMEVDKFNGNWMPY
jgi:hypothetical protein